KSLALNAIEPSAAADGNEWAGSAGWAADVGPGAGRRVGPGLDLVRGCPAIPGDREIGTVAGNGGDAQRQSQRVRERAGQHDGIVRFGRTLGIGGGDGQGRGSRAGKVEAAEVELKTPCAWVQVACRAG